MGWFLVKITVGLHSLVVLVVAVSGDGNTCHWQHHRLDRVEVSEREALAELVIAYSLSESMATYSRYVNKDLPSSEVGMSRTPCLFGAKDFRAFSKASSSSLRA